MEQARSRFVAHMSLSGPSRAACRLCPGLLPDPVHDLPHHVLHAQEQVSVRSHYLVNAGRTSARATGTPTATVASTGTTPRSTASDSTLSVLGLLLLHLVDELGSRQKRVSKPRAFETLRS